MVNAELKTVTSYVGVNGVHVVVKTTSAEVARNIAALAAAYMVTAL